MARLALVAVLVSATVCAAAAQPATAEAAPDSPPGVGIKVSFRPSVAIVVGIFTMIFSLTFLLLMYAKFCHSSSSPPPLPATFATAAAAHDAAAHGRDVAAASDGVPKPVIESLPFFRFATLRGARQGMECAVCLARFDDADLLRLLPRCRHAFHLDCVDQWLESSASCPLCRARVDAGDATLGLKYAASARIVFGGGDDDDAPVGSGRDLLDIFVERVPSSRFPAAGGGGSPRRRQEQEEEEEEKLDRHRHRIIVSDVVFKSRWSELNSADLIALDTEMLRSMSSGRFYFPQEEDAAVKAIREEKQLLIMSNQQQGTSTSKASAARLSSGVRSVSEIVSLPRLRAAARERMADEDNRRWLPIARRTARWFAGRANHKQGEEEEGGVHVV
ncbi:hypothetical protein EJB05_36286, partial [Eragrostis curvula]